MGRGGYILDYNQQGLYNVILREKRVLTYHRTILADIRGCGALNN